MIPAITDVAGSAPGQCPVALLMFNFNYGDLVPALVQTVVVVALHLDQVAHMQLYKWTLLLAMYIACAAVVHTVVAHTKLPRASAAHQHGWLAQD